MTNKKATEDQFNELHNLVTKEFLARIKSGEASTQDLKAACDWLAKNDISAVYNGGLDALGMDNAINFGSDITAAVDYSYNSDTDKGGLTINIGGNGSTVSFTNVDSTAVSFLGIRETDGTESDINKGLDVAGTINGVAAKGSGQFLTAQNGNVAASNGYYVSEQTEAVAGPVVIDGTNNTFTIELDGFESVISIAQDTYATGTALASAIQDAINNNTAIKDEELSVKVDYTSDLTSAAFGTIGIISTSTGVSSSVLIKDI